MELMHELRQTQPWVHLLVLRGATMSGTMFAVNAIMTSQKPTAG